MVGGSAITVINNARGEMSGWGVVLALGVAALVVMFLLGVVLLDWWKRRAARARLRRKG